MGKRYPSWMFGMPRKFDEFFSRAGTANIIGVILVSRAEECIDVLDAADASARTPIVNVYAARRKPETDPPVVEGRTLTGTWEPLNDKIGPMLLLVAQSDLQAITEVPAIQSRIRAVLGP